MRLPIEYNINLIKFTRLTVSAAAAAARAQAQAVNWAASLPSSATSRALRSAKQATNALHTAKYELEGRSIDRSDFEGDIVGDLFQLSRLRSALIRGTSKKYWSRNTQITGNLIFTLLFSYRVNIPR
ncbi:hypothetical protein H110_01733 [Trichophyton rubrum MR1448]|nr:hypothetical protein H110_01733 [Trichophyton rubrum MR1448]